MKTLYKYFAFLSIALIGLSACADDMELQEIKPVEQGDGYVTLNMGYLTQNDKEVTVSRSAATTPEKKLYDLHFYVFDVNGKLTGYKKIMPIDDNDVIEEAAQTEKVSIRAKSGESYIYAVANINRSTTYYLDKADLDLLNVNEGNSDEEYRINIEESTLTRDKLLSINFKRVYGNENNLFSPDPSGSVFVMSGYINDGQAVTIPKGTNVSLPQDKNIIKLYRILAKNTFTITSGTSKGKFTPKYYRLCNVPTGGVLIPKAGISSTDSYLTENVTLANVESSYHWNFEGKNEITFYYPENLQKAKNRDYTLWKDREKNSWTDNGKSFTNAANHAAYIEIYGDFVDHTGDITANVNYTIHFGDFSSTGSLYDFNVIRNHAYKYKVIIDGVDDIKVEAQTTTNEDNPYAEGLIIDATGGKHYDVDAHYEARVMKFEKSTIEDLKKNGSGYILSIKTPFGETIETVNVKNNGVYSMKGNKLCGFESIASIFTNEADYQWMKFVKNTTANRINRNADISLNTCKYPGDNSDDCLNVFELLAELYNEDAYTEKNNSEVYYTCFIDENYYVNKRWPDYVNKEPRTMLIANDLDVSTDKKSLYARVAYSISQRSISTFYTTDYIYPDGSNDLVKAFGTEIIDEEKKFNTSLSNNSYGTIQNRHDWNAWTSAESTNKNKGWYDNMKHIEGIQPMYSTVAKACMSRNRDLDGSGQIERNEVRWYLAAVDQYRALFFGQNALDADAYLITQEELRQINTDFGNGTVKYNDDKGHDYRGKYHYFSSSSGDKTTFWPEEGLTNNPINTSGWVSRAELVRCIRTLASGEVGLQDPEPFYTYNENTFELNGIKATRGYTEEPLGIHNEIEPLNNLYSSFVVAKRDLIAPENREDRDHNNFSLTNITDTDRDYCTEYYAKQDNVKNTDEANYKWRTPNQKEFALMVSKLPDNRYGTRTKFSGDDSNRGYWNWHDTPGFWSDSGGGGRINVGTGHESGVKIRCVRDN